LDNPEDAQRFLGIIARQANRLNAIIEDLLLLSRIEQGAEKAGIKLEEGHIKEVLQAAVQACASKAAEKAIHITVTCDDELRAKMKPELLEQAVVNLIDNAIKYSETGSPVEISALQTKSEVTISVTDRGCGIERDHLPRLFERFYRVDKGRSRNLGGTGLGLAIVKHIAQAHGGWVSVESTPGKGSTFAVHLPKDSL